MKRKEYKLESGLKPARTQDAGESGMMTSRFSEHTYTVYDYTGSMITYVSVKSNRFLFDGERFSREVKVYVGVKNGMSGKCKFQKVSPAFAANMLRLTRRKLKRLNQVAI